MSYEIHLLRIAPDEDPRAAFSLHLERQADTLNPGPVVPAKEAEKQRLARALLRFNPALTIAEFDFDGLAGIQRVDLDEARRRYRHLELNADDYTGIQITLWDDSAEITFPYWHNGKQALSVLQQVFQYLEVLTQWGGFVAFDPQLDRALAGQASFADVWRHYSEDDSSVKAASR